MNKDRNMKMNMRYFLLEINFRNAKAHGMFWHVEHEVIFVFVDIHLFVCGRNEHPDHSSEH